MKQTLHSFSLKLDKEYCILEILTQLQDLATHWFGVFLIRCTINNLCSQSQSAWVLGRLQQCPKFELGSLSTSNLSCLLLRKNNPLQQVKYLISNKHSLGKQSSSLLSINTQVAKHFQVTYARTYEEQCFSPLSKVTQSSNLILCINRFSCSQSKHCKIHWRTLLLWTWILLPALLLL